MRIRHDCCKARGPRCSLVDDNPISRQLLGLQNELPLPEMKAASFRCFFKKLNFVEMSILGLKSEAFSGQRGYCVAHSTGWEDKVPWLSSPLPWRHGRSLLPQ